MFNIKSPASILKGGPKVLILEYMILILKLDNVLIKKRKYVFAIFYA